MANTTPKFSQLAEKRREQLHALVASLEILPTSVGVPMRVLRLKQSGTAGAAEIAQVLSADAGLAAKILSLVNSAAFATTHRVTRMSQAVAMIGLKNLMPLVFGLSLNGLFNKLSMRAEDRAVLFQSALFKACTAGAVAALTAPDKREEAILCGLMQDVALPLILASDRAAWPEAAKTLDENPDREPQLYGTDHAEIGRAVAERLKLPELFVSAIGRHHAGIEALAAVAGPGLARALDAAAAVPHRIVSRSPKALQPLARKLQSITSTSGKPAGGPAGTAPADALLADIIETYSGLAKVFGEADDAALAFKQFMDEVTREVACSMEEAVVASQTTIVGLRTREVGLVRQVDDLKQQVARAELDALTGLLNRAGFLRRVELLLRGARDNGTELSIGFADIDNFKRVNDTYGHALGDAAIRAVADRLASVIRQNGLVSRMGGDEFAFVVVCRDRAAADEVARGLATDFAKIDVPNGAEVVPITASTGLFAIGVPRPDDTTEGVLARADQLMYEVKRSGKGRCLTGGPTPPNTRSIAA